MNVLIALYLTRAMVLGLKAISFSIAYSLATLIECWLLEWCEFLIS